MNNLETAAATITSIINHQVGNKLKEEPLGLTNETTKIESDETRSYLLEYFLSGFKPVDFYRFNHTVELGMNNALTLVNRLMESEETFVEDSQNLAKLLFEHSTHPKVKEGAMSVVMFDSISWNGEMIKALGVFKSESNVPFIKMHHSVQQYTIEHEFGFELKGIDKGCLILDVNKDEGYQVMVIDSSNRFGDTQYWSSDFLNLEPCNDEFHNTKDFLKLTKDFVVNQLPEEFEVTKTDKVDLLNRTMDYFKSNDQFEKEEFEEVVFQDQNVINSFRTYNEVYKEDHDVAVEPTFEISTHAIKTQNKAYKSVLKLDKNFHVYIHGNKDMIERGVDPDGRKFYKLFYNNEE